MSAMFLRNHPRLPAFLASAGRVRSVRPARVPGLAPIPGLRRIAALRRAVSANSSFASFRGAVADASMDCLRLPYGRSTA